MPFVLFSSQAPPTFTVPFTSSLDDGVVVPMPTLPPLRTVNAAGDDVAYASVVVPTYKLPPIEETSQCFKLVPPEVSESAKDGLEPATWRFQFGVVVPIPKKPVFFLTTKRQRERSLS